MLGSDRINVGLTNGALRLAYQPKVDLSNGALIGVEALLRWHDPEFGCLPAPEVIRAAERAGMIDPLTLAVLTRAVTDRASLLRDNIDINIAINVSGAATMQFLMQLPSTELKIDHRFVAAAPRSEHGRVFLQSAIELGLHLGQTVSVEGVETESEAQLARKLGSHLGQGYFYGRPMELEELIDWTSTHSSPRGRDPLATS